MAIIQMLSLSKNGRQSSRRYWHRRCFVGKGNKWWEVSLTWRMISVWWAPAEAQHPWDVFPSTRVLDVTPRAWWQHHWYDNRLTLHTFDPLLWWRVCLPSRSRSCRTSTNDVPYVLIMVKCVRLSPTSALRPRWYTSWLIGACVCRSWLWCWPENKGAESSGAISSSESYPGW